MQKISYQADQILINLMRGLKSVCKTNFGATVAAQENNCIMKM